VSESPWNALWSLRPGVSYLNHGSFGPTPGVVSAARREWISRLEAEPMDFFVRQMEGHLDRARQIVGAVFGTAGNNLLLLDNATFGMNVVASSFPLQAGDEILATNHEYGAVLRTWRETCKLRGAHLVVQRLPERFGTADEVVAALFAGVSERTRLIVVSHITSPTALILPVAEICRAARQRGIAVCIDGPHALAAVDVHLDRLDCDFYCASGHKWLCAPFGSGFLYVHPRWQNRVRPVVVSWGDSLSGRPHSWQDEFVWSGTRDPSPFLAMPAACDFYARLAAPPGAPLPASEPHSRFVADVHQGFRVFRDVSRGLVARARNAIHEITREDAIGTPDWYGTMVTMPLPERIGDIPHGHMHPLQKRLWDDFQIEAPVTSWNGRRHLRVSCHLYNTAAEIDRLAAALKNVLADHSARS
jgi:isopenicillin-N epimerase